MKNRIIPYVNHDFHAATRAPASKMLHGHRQGSKVAAFVMMPLEDNSPDYGLLMVKRANAKGKVWWEVPGGSMEPQDKGNPRHAVIREVREETGVVVTTDAPYPVYYQTPNGRTVKFYWCNYVSGRPSNAAADEHLDVAVAPLDELALKVVKGEVTATFRGIEVQMPFELIEALQIDNIEPLGIVKTESPTGP